jgi:SOS-response transcriptional repressor LexA
MVGEGSDILDDLMRLRPEGMSPNRWATLAGVSRTVWSDMRRHGNPSRRTLDKLLTAAGSSLAEFEALRVGIIPPPQVRPAPPDGHVSEKGMSWRGAGRMPVPLCENRPAGEWVRGVECVTIGAQQEGQGLDRPASLVADHDAYAVTIIGDSMWPRYRVGRRLLVSPAAPVAIGDDVVVHLAGEARALIKELVRRSSSDIALRQFNPDRQFTVAADRIARIEKVVGEAV